MRNIEGNNEIMIMKNERNIMKKRNESNEWRQWLMTKMWNNDRNEDKWK